MKKLVMLGLMLMSAACPVACVNDPTDSQEVPTSWETSTETVEDLETSTDVVTDTVVETTTDTDTDTATATELPESTKKSIIRQIEQSGILE